MSKSLATTRKIPNPTPGVALFWRGLRSCHAPPSRRREINANLTRIASYQRAA